ncbi:MAG: hypothetical protein V1663_05690 [archaeon]
MERIERNVKYSFRIVKREIINLQRRINEISQAQERMIDVMNGLKENEMKLTDLFKQTFDNINKKNNPTILRKIVEKKAKINYVARKGSKKFHIDSCPFAKNIKPKNKIRFETRVKALNEGYKPCKCVSN